MKYEIYDWGGVVPWLLRQDGTFLVDPRYLRDFLDMTAGLIEDNLELENGK